MKDILIEKQRVSYGCEFEKHGTSPAGTFQNDRETQHLRFDRLLRNILPLLNNHSIHDVGAGTCELHDYLVKRDVHHSYSGTEIVQGMIDYSHLRYPDIEILNRNLLDADDSEKYDFLVLSGTMNLLGGNIESDWKQYCFDLIKKMFAMARKGIAFNFLTTYNTFTDPDLLYLAPEEVYTFCISNLSRFCNLDNAYPLYEVTLTVFNKEFMRDIFKKDQFSKYFNN